MTETNKQNLMKMVPEFDSKTAFGTNNVELQKALIAQLVNSLWCPPDGLDETHTATCFAVLMEIKPRDVFEGQIGAQMFATHNAAMECFKRAAQSSQSRQVIDAELRSATKLMSVYLQQLEAIDRHRGKGAPQVNVENVNVQAGGQAVVGHVETKPRRSRKNVDRGPLPRAVPIKPVETLETRPRVVSADGDERIKRYAK